MEQGFTADATDNYIKAGAWIEGAPQKAWWGGVKTRGRKKLAVETWRCGRCHYLESYAPDA
jgi:hypothetical protein